MFVTVAIILPHGYDIEKADKDSINSKVKVSTMQAKNIYELCFICSIGTALSEAYSSRLSTAFHSLLPSSH